MKIELKNEVENSVHEMKNEMENSLKNEIEISVKNSTNDMKSEMKNEMKFNEFKEDEIVDSQNGVITKLTIPVKLPDQEEKEESLELNTFEEYANKMKNEEPIHTSTFKKGFQE